MNEPKGVQKPPIPIMIGGGGEKKTLRTVARYADTCNLFANFMAGSAQRVIDEIGPLDELGIDEVILILQPAEVKYLERFDAEVIQAMPPALKV